MPLDRKVQEYAAQVAELVHAEQPAEAARYVAELCKLKLKLDGDNPAKYLPVLQNWLHFLLNNDGTVEAAQLLWTPTQFDPRPQYTRNVWKLYDECSMGLIQGGASCSKSFGMGVRLFLEYVRDPEFTAIKVVGPSKEHLEANLFSALVGLHGSASLPMPGKVGQLFIGMTRRDQLGSIRGVTIPVGQTKKAGRIQGTKRKPRSQPHPIFGPLSRLFVFMDEVENIPGGIWSDVDNILSQVDAEGVAGFKILAAWNPRDLTHEVAKRAEPEFGWEGVEADTHYRWKSRRGWEVLRLDGEQSENVKQNRTVYPGLQTRAGLEIIAKNGGGRDSAGYDTMGRGMYPKRGMVTSIIPLGMFRSWRGIFIWQEEPRAVASCDLALDGGAAALFTLGKMGRASGMKLTPTLEHPLGRTIMFKNLRGQPQSRLGLQADQQFAVPKGDSVEMAERIVVLNKRAGVKPEFFACDRTGHGAGTADLIKHNWGVGIHDVNYSDGASKTKLMEESTKTCAEEYDRACSELWYALRAYGEYGYLLINPELDASKLQGQVTERLSKTSGKKSHVESKKDYMSRGNLSPDDADSLTLFVHAARKGSGIILSQMPESSDGYSGDDGDGEWYDGFVALKGGTHIDPSNRTDTL